MRRGDRLTVAAPLSPAGAFLAAFSLLPLVLMLRTGASGPGGIATCGAILAHARYLGSLAQMAVLAGTVTVATLVVSGIAGVFLLCHRFPFRRLLVAIPTLPLAFPVGVPHVPGRTLSAALPEGRVETWSRPEALRLDLAGGLAGRLLRAGLVGRPRAKPMPHTNPAKVTPL